MNIAQRILASLYRVFGPPVHTFDVHGDLKSTGQKNLEMPRDLSSPPQAFYDALAGGPPLSDEEKGGRGIRTFYPELAAAPGINYMVLQEYAYANDLDYNELCAVVRRAVLSR